MLSAKLVESIPQSIRMIRKFSTQSLGGYMTLQQFRVLSLVKEGQGQTQMAETLDVSLAAISKMVTYLASQEFITRKSGPDKRAQLLKLTPKGKSTLDKVKRFVEQSLEIGIEELSREEKIDLMKGLEILDKLTQKMKEV